MGDAVEQMVCLVYFSGRLLVPQEKNLIKWRLPFNIYFQKDIKRIVHPKNEISTIILKNVSTVLSYS